MKILVLHQWLPLGGVEKVLINYLNLLKELDYEVELLITYDLGSENFFEAEIAPNVPYSFVFSHQEVQRKNQLKLDKKHSLFKLLAFEYKRLKQHWHYKNVLTQKIQANHYDLIIDFNESLDWLVRLPAFLRPVLPRSIRWVHNQPNGKLTTWSAKTVKKLRQIYRQHHLIVALCPAMKATIQNQLGLADEKIAVLANPLDLDWIEIQKKQILPDMQALLTRPYLLQVGRLSPQKRHDVLLDIYAQLKQNGVQHQLYIVGSGELHADLTEKIYKLGLQQDCLLIDAQSNPFPFYQHADLFLHTADFEGLPTVLLESMACGTPVVAMDCPTGPRDILGAKSEFGCLINSHDQTKFVSQVIELLNNPNLKQHYINQSFARAQDYSMATIKHQLAHLIEQGAERR